MPVLHFGVVEVDYAAPRSAGRRRKGSNNPPSQVKSTGDVAEILEAKYQIMETFYETLGADVIASSLEHSLEDAIKDIQAGAPAKNLSVTLAAEQELQTAFQIFIDQQEMNGRPGVPTKDALKGVNHRLLHPNASSNPARPSFKDTGLYMQSFRAWMTQ